MWGAISKIFTKNSSFNNSSSEPQPPDEMDRGERKNYSHFDDSFTTKQAKQRASIKWLLSKAFNNKVPENIQEPFYRDHEDQEHLKPQIAGALANAEIYCRALANIYSDPNYHNLNHWAILQTLSRKSTHVTEPSDGCQLTETTLIQTNPLRMNAHMTVIESIMQLYAKEVITSDRVVAAVQRFNHGRVPSPLVPSSHEQGAVLWIQHACDALRERIEQELGKGISDNGAEGDRLKPPDFPSCQDLKDLCDGVGLATLVAYYCPEELCWTDIRISAVPSVQDSVHNLRLVRDFCTRCLPASIFHLQPEDITYLRDSMRLNLLVFLADLFNVMEIHPLSCVREKFSSVSTSSAHLPLRKSNSLQQSQQTLASEFSEDSLRRGSDESFVVHKGRNIPTLRSVHTEDPLIPARLKVSKEKQNNDSKADERGEVAAGKPSNWEESRKSSYAGRRSRRNSTTDESQLTIENFGGSQDNLNFIGRNPDKEMTVHIGRKVSAPSFTAAVENAPVRSTLLDAKGSFQLGYDKGCEEKQDDGSEKVRLKRQISSDDITLKSLRDKSVIKDLVDGEVRNRMSFADLGKQKVLAENKGIQIVYMNDREELPAKSSFLNRDGTTNGEKKTSFATLPNQTTWQQQVSSIQSYEDGSNIAEIGGTSNVMSSQLNDIRLKLEEKRRHIESEKRRMEVAMNKQRQKVGKAAFLQAVSKGRGSLLKTATNDATEFSKDSAAKPSLSEKTSSPSTASVPTPKPQRPFTLQEITDDASSVEKKWFDDTTPFIETRRTPDLENMNYEQYQQSLAQMNSSLSDIQSDIQRLAVQQNQMQTQQQQKLIAEQQRQILQLQQQQQQQQQYQSIHKQQSHQSPNTQYLQSSKFQHENSYPSPLQSSMSAPHIPQSLYSQPRTAEQQEFFLHDDSPATLAAVTSQRRTWVQSQPLQISTDSFALPQQPELRTWGKPQAIQPEPSPEGFVLHHTMDRYAERQDRFHESPSRPTDNRYQNGSSDKTLNHSNSFTLSQRHHEQSHLGTSHSTPSASPQHRRNIHRQISQLLDDASIVKRQPYPVSLQALDSSGNGSRDRERKTSVTHAPVAVPPVDDMEPQNISFIGNNEDAALSESLSKLNITSGSRTYRIPSPTRSLISRSSPFQPSPSPPIIEPLPYAQVSTLEGDPSTEKGFYISFDDEQPKRPKPALRSKRNSPKKERSYVESPEETAERREAQIRLENKRQLERELEEERFRKEEADKRQFLIQQEKDLAKARREASLERQRIVAASALVIGEQNETDPDIVDEREKKKEKIMMLSLQRRQQQEETKARKEAEAQRRKEQEKEKEEEKARRREEQAARRAAILEQYKLKKAIEEAEREGKTIDKHDLISLKPTPKLRPKGNSRPRPKTIHIDTGSIQLAEGMSSRGRKGSTSNLTVYTPSSMKRDYYRGSQDSLADRSMSSTMIYKDSPDDSHGMSPCHSANQTLGRRSSYKTSRGSSTDQDSLAYRFGDTDSGLGRATPPRRAPSPGMGLRHLTSPSGPGSLPGLMTKGRRVFDDGSSDISSTPSSMMDYTGPRLYKQPATKSNRSIMLNAVEYCVFPGVVNREAKKRVLEEINRSESKHFLILFRDAGCQFRALYSFCPDTEVVMKLYGTGPKQVNDKMFDKFFKYNSGGKCFSQVHTKHLTVTIDAFTIHNSLWQGKKVNLPSKKDMALVV